MKKYNNKIGDFSSRSIVGTWKLLKNKLKLFDKDGTEQVHHFHDGVISYGENGLMAAQLMADGHEESIPGNAFEASAEAYKRAVETYIAYYGRYTIDTANNLIVHHVTAALMPNMIGTKLSRQFEFKDENTLVLSLVEPESTVSENYGSGYLSWSRIV